MSSSLNREQALSVDGTEFKFVEFGSRDERPPLVLLHGISMPPTHWGEFPGEMGRYTVALGRPEGNNAPTIPTVNGYVNKMIPAIHEIAGHEYDLLGLSWGGLPAQGIALKDKQHIRRLIIAGTLPLTPIPFIGVPDLKATAAVWSIKRSHESVARVYGGDLNNNPEIADKLKNIISRPIDGVNHSRQLFAGMTCGSLVAQRLFQRFVQNDAPETLVMAGDDDPIIPYQTVKLGASILNMTLVTMPKGGHGFLLTRPKESAEIINDFLDA